MVLSQGAHTRPPSVVGHGDNNFVPKPPPLAPAPSSLGRSSGLSLGLSLGLPMSGL